MTIPTLLIHGDADASSPIDLSSRQSAKLIAGSQLEVYENTAQFPANAGPLSNVHR